MIDGVRHDAGTPWYHGITRYQWLVLTIASLGWVFDIYEGQIFVSTMNEWKKDLVPPEHASFFGNLALAAFLVGGALGGVVFGVISDRIGRTKTMILTILVYSLFSFATAFARSQWDMAILRFLVALGVGGEWAVASAMVAEVFPARARARFGAFFHATSVLGTYLAVLAGVFVVPTLGWRWAFALGALPALLTLWIRWRLREPERWQRARDEAARDATKRTGRLGELFDGAHLRRTLIGVGFAAVGLATFWGAHIYGKDFLHGFEVRELLRVEGVRAESGAAVRAAVLAAHERELKFAEMLGMFLVTTGGGMGLLAFGPLCERFGRRGAFLFFHAGGLAISLVFFHGVFDAGRLGLWFGLPVFGFLTLGMHAGYAVYFPELFPTRLRGTGAGFCFNAGRIVAAPILILKGVLQSPEGDGGWGYTAEEAGALLCWLFLAGVVLVLFAPETRGQELPE